MNQQLQKFARESIISGLRQLPVAHVNLFKRMYSRRDESVDDIVKHIPEDKLDWAMEQVRRTLENIGDIAE